jgi:hypothetical protein
LLNTPVVGEGIGQRLRPWWQRVLADQQGRQRLQHPTGIARTAFPQTAGQAQGQFRINVGQRGQAAFLIGGAGEHEQEPPWACLGPGLQALEAIAPMAAPTQQPHHHDLRLRRGGSQVVVDHRRVTEGSQVEPAQLSTQQLGLLLEQVVDRE